MADRYAGVRKLLKAPVIVGTKDTGVAQVMRSLPDAVVVFDTGRREERRLVEACRHRGVAVRLVDVAGLVASRMDVPDECDPHPSS
jgi:hypothetical protein